MPVINPSQENLDNAASQLRDGQLVAFPTETVYGLGGDACSEKAVAAIFQSKKRPADHPLIVHVSDYQAAQWWAPFDDIALTLARAFWPGPLTLIMRRHEQAPGYACGGQSTVGLRAPSHPVAQAFLRAFESLGTSGVAGPSANRFGRVSPTAAAHVIDELGQALTVLDGGECTIGLESTIVDLSTGVPRVLRPGAISAAQLNAVLPGGLSDAGSARAQSSDIPQVSGSLAAHYAPGHHLHLVKSSQLEALVTELTEKGQRLAVCSSRRPVSPVSHWEQADNNALGFGQRLYAMLRDFDALPIDAMVIERPPDDARWLAIHDRLNRAATGSLLS